MFNLFKKKKYNIKPLGVKKTIRPEEVLTFNDFAQNILEFKKEYKRKKFGNTLNAKQNCEY